MKRVILLALLVWFIVLKLHATHNRAGEITYIQTGPLSVKMTITTYTKTSSIGADKDSLEVFWGDGTKEWVARTNGEGMPLDNDIKLNYYVKDHIYPGRGTYTISFRDPNRVGGIINLNFPRSEEIQFFLSTTLTLLDVQFQGRNNSAILLQPPIDIACIGQPFIHNPNAYDPDGDSLSYQLIVPYGGPDEEVPNYFFPNEVLPGPLNQISLNAVTGEFIWNSPPQAGEYNIAFRINEYRGGVLINSIVRDMQILVKACNNAPPNITMDEEYCVIAGQKISIPIKVTDPNQNQKIKLTATGGPMVHSYGVAVLNGPIFFSSQPLNATLEWQTNCNHISKEYYQIVIKAIDNAFGDTFGLATLKTIRIKVVGPPPDITSIVNKDNDKLRLEWRLPYECENTKDDYFIGFSIWRKEKPAEIDIDTCHLKTLNPPYQRIVFLTKQNDTKTYFHEDSGLKANATYCYRVLAIFAGKTATGNAFNRVESIPSQEVCAQLKRDIPLITKASVAVTNVNIGSINIEWTKPLIRDFDTIKFMPPYKTELYHREKGGSFTLAPNSTKIFTSFGSWKDTSFLDGNLNTLQNQYEYQLKFYYNGDTELRELPSASSVFTIVTPSDHKNMVSLNEDVPWANHRYHIYRSDNLGPYQLIQTVSKLPYVDENLSNEITYCYYVETMGSYGIKDIVDPLINLSQVYCSKPLDNEPPCALNLEIETICSKETFTTDDLYNLLKWKNISTCFSEEKPTHYNIYYKASIKDEYTLLRSVNYPDKSLSHLPELNSIAGCYSVSAVDIFGNESENSNEVCIENCPTYELPNTFTPNEDGTNELFKPLKNYFINSVIFEVFNEWGMKVYETTNPAINWDGKYKDERLADGTYYYTCSAFVNTTNGLTPFSKLKGYINIIR